MNFPAATKLIIAIVCHYFGEARFVRGAMHNYIILCYAIPTRCVAIVEF